MKKPILLYFPYDLNSRESGSRVRPNKIIENFKKLEYDFILIKGNSYKRKKIIEKIIKNKMDFLFCYSEPSTYPVHPFIDYRMYYYLKKMKIPTGIFYRDAYWKFNLYFQKRGIKKLELFLRYRLDFYLFNIFAKIIFFPTDSMRKLFKVKTKTAILPPGGEEFFLENKITHKKFRGIYVGGISTRYGINILLDAFEIVNQRQKIELIIVCRKNEYESLDFATKEKIKKNWVRLYHISGNKLAGLYQDSDFGVIPRIRDEYNNLAMPIKLFEYLSYGIPIIATNCYEMGKFIKKYQCGVLCEDNAESLADSINKIGSNKNFFANLSNNAKKVLLDDNLWTDRVMSIVQTMTRIASKNNSTIMQK